MKTFIKESFEILGARVTNCDDDELIIRTGESSRAKALLGKESEQRLAFTAKPNRKALLVVPGSQLLDSLKCYLSEIGSVRHGLYPKKVQLSRKDLKNIFQVFAGKVAKFSARSSWQTTVRCYVKIVLTGDEFIEKIALIEVSPSGSSKIVEDEPELTAEVKWVERPPIQRYRLEDLIKKGLIFVEKVAIEKAGDLQAERLKGLYKTLKQLRTYYRKLIADNRRKENEDAVTTLESEYRYRKNEEMEHARVRAVIKIIALETVSTPVKNIRLIIERDDCIREVISCVSCMDGKILDPVRCQVCDRVTSSFGISASGKIVCAYCCTNCKFCDSEIIAPNAIKKHSCSTCGRQICEKHSVNCDICRELVCFDHVLQCQEGCHICNNCVRRCHECGDSVNWCRDHTMVSSSGEVTCQNHAVYCIDCCEHHPGYKTTTCTACGQTICCECQKICNHCKRVFCFNHIKEGRCLECRTELETMAVRDQMKLFRQQLSQKLKFCKN